MTSKGQPFGYRVDAPNSRAEVKETRKAWDIWLFGSEEEAGKVDWENPQGVIGRLRKHFDSRLSGKEGYDEALPASNATEEDVSGAMLFLRRHAFGLVEEKDLIGGNKQIYPLAPLLRHLNPSLGEAVKRHSNPDSYRVKPNEEAREKWATVGELKNEFEQVVNLEVAVKKVGDGLLEGKDDYEEFFKRIGQGGTALSDDELAYSLIKVRFPEARERLDAIVKTIGHLADPTQIALAGLRLVRIQSGDPAKVWESIGRPTPDFVAGLPRERMGSDEAGDGEKEGKDELATKFREFLGGTEADGRLAGLMKNFRKLLEGKSDSGPDDQTAFPAILLGRLPKEMIDIGLMLVGFEKLRNIDESVRRAFCLWCLAFGNAAYTANFLAKDVLENKADTDGNEPLRTVIKNLEAEGKANMAPGCEDLKKLCSVIPKPSKDDDKKPPLQDRETRFKPSEVDQRIGNAINELHYGSIHGKNALLWLQRAYLKKNFPEYDPTSDRDEDLPVDLDHIVPKERFGSYWEKGGYPQRQDGTRMDEGDKSDRAVLDNVRGYRNEIGNLLGNLRWLSFSENRSRGAAKTSEFMELKGADDLTDSAGFCAQIAGKQNLKDAFECLINLGRNPDGNSDGKGFSGWKAGDIGRWQYLVELRQLELVRRLIEDSGIDKLLPKRPKSDAISGTKGTVPEPQQD